MNELSTRERAALEAVAKRFGATWEKSGKPPDACLTVGGKRISVEIAEIKRRIDGKHRPARFRLRFDKVALRVVQGLQDTLRDCVPDGKTVIVIITAPIKLASKTTEALEEKIRKRLARGSARGNTKEVIHRNHIGMRVANGSAGGKKVIGFVHNPDPRAETLLNVACSLIEAIGGEGRKSAPLKSGNGRWLICVNADEPTYIDTYRQVFPLLPISSGFEKALMAFEDGRIEALNE